MNYHWKQKIVPYLLIMPNLLVYTVFIFIPVIWVLILSFTSFSILNPGEYVGFANYIKMANDSIFIEAVGNTLQFWIFTVIPQMVIGLILAVLLHSKIRGVAVFRAGIYLPVVISSVAVAMTWLWLYDPIQGPVNQVMGWFGHSGYDWLKDPDVALLAIIIVGIWVGIGFAMIIYLAGIQGIPEHLYEAASIDGATGIRQFFIITVPLLKPMTFFLFVTSTIKSFQVFDLVYIMTKGGPVNTTNTIVTEIIATSFERYEMGYASALAIFLLGLTLVVTLVNYKVGSKDNDMT